MIDKRALRWEVMDAGGWEYLLPRATRRRWLCFDTSRGAIALILAGLCDELHVTPASREAAGEIVEKVRADGVDNVWLSPDGALAETARDGGAFDGFILHDLPGVLGRRAAEEALRAGARRVAPGGFLYVALRNRYGYTRLRRGWSGFRPRHGGAYFSPRTVRRLVGDGRETVLYPLISTEDGRVTEMVPPGGYVSAKSPSLVNETLRRWLLGRYGARRWSPGFAVVSTGEPGVRSGLECALETLYTHGLLTARVERGTLVKRYHVLTGGKAIVSVGETPARYGSHVVVLVHSPEFVARRRYEGELLSRLAGLPADLASRIPRFCYEAEAGGAHVFVLQEFPGVTLDAPVAGLRVATGDAAHFITRLHLATRQATRLTPTRFAAVFGSALKTARSRYPALVGVLGRLEAALQKSLIGAECPVVWMHGDFKIENVVVDERSFRLLGVIDWELSEPEGLPLLDLWYLLLYNRMIERGVDFLTVVGDMLPPERLAGEDAARCADYMRVLDVPDRLVPGLAGALIVHHAARRMDMDPNDGQEMGRLRGLLETAAEWNEGAPVRHG